MNADRRCSVAPPDRDSSSSEIDASAQVRWRWRRRIGGAQKKCRRVVLAMASDQRLVGSKVEPDSCRCAVEAGLTGGTIGIEGEVAARQQVGLVLDARLS